MKKLTCTFASLLLLYSCDFFGNNPSESTTTSEDPIVEEEKTIKEKFQVQELYDELPELIVEEEEFIFRKNGCDFIVKNSNLGYVLDLAIVKNATSLYIPSCFTKADCISGNAIDKQNYIISVYDTSLIDYNGRLDKVQFEFLHDYSVYFYPEIFRHTYYYSDLILKFEEHSYDIDFYIHKDAFGTLDEKNVYLNFADGSTFQNTVKHFWFLLKRAKFTDFLHVGFTIDFHVDVWALKTEGILDERALRVTNMNIWADYIDGSKDDPWKISDNEYHYMFSREFDFHKLIDVENSPLDQPSGGYIVNPWNVALHNYVASDGSGEIFYVANYDFKFDIHQACFTVSNQNPFKYKTICYELNNVASNDVVSPETGVILYLHSSLDFSND